MRSPDTPPPPCPRYGLLDGRERVVEVDLSALDEARAGPLSWRVFAKLGAALATFAALVVLSYAIPLPWAQPWRVGEDYVPFWNLIGRELLGEDQALAAASDAVAELERIADNAAQLDEIDQVPARVAIDRAPAANLRFGAYEPQPLDPLPEELAVELDGAAELDSFYAALTLSDLGYASALTRVGHWGDSVIGNDGITSAVRRRMQARFGDGGHGWHAIERYDASYRHQGVVFEQLGNTRWQVCGVRRRCMDDRHYGYGGVTAWSSGRARSRIASARKGPVGHAISRVELWYAAQPGGGVLELAVDGQAQRIDTSQAGEPGEPVTALTDAWLTIELADGAHELELRAAGGGPVRAYGVVLERSGPGVVWDGMALIGSFTNRLADQDPDHFAAQLARRDLDLVVLSFGGNDMTRERSDLGHSMRAYVRDYEALLARFREAEPDLACLIVGPVDHGERVGGRVVSREISARMSEAQREVARAHGCAYFDTLTAMGGSGSVARWRSRSLMSPDLAHPSPRGHRILGAMIYAALMRGYQDYRARQLGQLIPTAPPRGLP